MCSFIQQLLVSLGGKVLRKGQLLPFTFWYVRVGCDKYASRLQGHRPGPGPSGTCVTLGWPPLVLLDLPRKVLKAFGAFCKSKLGSFFLMIVMFYRSRLVA